MQRSKDLDERTRGGGVLRHRRIVVEHLGELDGDGGDTGAVQCRGKVCELRLDGGNNRSGRRGRLGCRVGLALDAAVAEVYRRNINGAPTQAVAKAFGVKSRMASTYVDRARQAGLLPQTKQGKKKA